MTPERNALMEHAYPRLKEYCRTKYRFEFQVTNTGRHVACTSGVRECKDLYAQKRRSVYND